MSERVVARVAKAHGIKGEVAVEVLTSVPEARFAPGARLLEVDGHRVFTVRGARPHHGRLLLTLEEVSDRSAAEALEGVLLAGADDVALPDGEMWASDLEGYAVLSTSGARVGTVTEVLENPAHELLVVELGDGTQALVPLVEAFVVGIEEDRREIVLDPPEGLL